MERVSDIDEREVKRFLLPLLRKGEESPGLEEMKEAATSHLQTALDLTRSERRFLDIFYDEGRFDQGALFGDLPVATNLADHPAIVWRLARSL